MIVLDQCKHFKSMDWIDWKLSKLETIHLLKWRMFFGMSWIIHKQIVLITNRNHSTYWIVNHWNLFTLVNVVSVILLENLNWRIYHNYNPFTLEQLELIHTIFIIVHLWFEVWMWYWIFEWLDLPNLLSITLGDWTFANILSAVFESIKCEWLDNSLDLPSLQSITLGRYALHGRYGEGPCYSLTMRSKNYAVLLEWDLPLLESLSSQGKSFSSPHIVVLESILTTHS